MSKEQVSDLIESGVGFAIRSSDPEFNEDGELTGYVLDSGEDPDTERDFDGVEYRNRWFLSEMEGITRPEAEQNDDAGYWQMEEEDPLWNLHHEGPAFGLWDSEGKKKLGSDESRYLARKKIDREVRFERMRAYLDRVPVASLPKVRSAMMAKYVGSVKECVKLNCWHGLLLTREQKDALLDQIRRRIAGK